MKRSRGWSLAVAASAGVGTGTVCAVASLWLHLARPEVPFPTASRLVEIVSDEDFGISDATVIVDALRARPDLFDRAVIYKDNLGLTAEGDRSGRIGIVGAFDLMETLGVEPLLGRPFRAEEDVPGSGRSILLSESFWRARFGGDAGVVGADIDFEGRLGAVTVVGVLPDAGIRLPLLGPGAAFVMPLGNVLGDPTWLTDVSLLARVAPGRSRRNAVEWWKATAPQLLAGIDARPSGSGGRAPTFVLRPLRGLPLGARMPWMVTALGVAGILALCVAVLNVGVLSLLFALRSAHAIAVRRALGASRRSVALLVMRRCLVPVLVGGGFGVGVAWLVLERLRADAFENVAYIVPQISGSTAAGALGACALFTMLGVLVAARPVLRSEPTRSLGQSADGASGSHLWRLRAIVTAEVAVVSAVLMVGVLFHSSVRAYVAEDRGFERTDVSFARVTLDPAAGQNAATMDAILSDPALAAMGIAVGGPPLSGHVLGFPGVVQGPDTPEPAAARTWVAPVSSGYPSMLGIELVQGRFFTSREAAAGDPVAVVDSATARALGGDGSLIGRSIDVWIGDRRVHAQVVGTVAPLALIDAKTGGRVQQVYVPFALDDAREYPLVLGTGLARSAPAAVARAAPGASLGPLSRFEDLHRAEARTQLVAAVALSWVAGLGLVLALVGLFAALGYAVERRRRELGVRQAVGGTPRDMVRLALGFGLAISGWGLLIGLAAAVVAGRVLRSALLGVLPWDARSATLTAALVLLSALAACARPALLAGRCDPSELMRAE